MKIMIICSKQFYPRIEEIKGYLEEKNITVILPNCYDNPRAEAAARELGKEEHQKFKAAMYKRSEKEIRKADAVLVLNFDKEKDGVVLKNYIGGATFLEMYDAFRLGKKIYLFNDIPEGMLYDEIEGFSPVIINGNLELISGNEIAPGRQIDPRFLAAVEMLEVSINNSRAYADSISTEEEKREQAERIDRALEQAAHKEGSAYCRAHVRIRH